jgi:large subunit ribosomal protein L24
MTQITKYQAKCKLKKGDEVIVISGRSRGKTGKIDRIDFKRDAVFLSGVHTVKRNTKPNLTNQEGGIVDKAAPLPICNVALVDPKTKKPTRVGFKIEDGKKVRFAKKSGIILS